MAIIKFPEIDLTNVKAVLIDLDDTLYNYESSHQHAIKICYDKFFADKTDLATFLTKYKNKRVAVVKSLKGQGACRSRFLAFQHLLEEMQDDDSYVKAMLLDELYWNSLIDVMKLEDDAKNFLELCKNKGLDVCVVTDMLAITQVKKLQKLQITNYVKYLVTSEEVGIEKPNELMFRTALKKLNLEPQDVIMIGDNFEKDIKGAQALGIKAYQVTNIS